MKLMKSYKELIREIQLTEGVETPEDVMAGIETAFKKSFPNGWIDIEIRNMLGMDSISFTLGLIGDKSQWGNGIQMNDPMHHTFVVYYKDGVYEASNSRGRIYLKPDEGTHYAMKGLKTNFRKSKGSADKVLKAFTTWFPRLKTLVKDNEENFYRRDRYSDKFFK